MNPPPRVSVLIPACRAAAYLGTALASVATQTCNDWEILVFEDGIYDDTAAIVRAFAATTANRVELLRSATNLGVSRARNALLDVARGEYIAFLDADDTWEPDHLALALALLAAAPADWFIGGTNTMDEQGRYLQRDIIPAPRPAAAIPTALLRCNFVLTGAVVVRAEPFARGLRFDPALTIGEDLDLWIGLVAAGCRPVFASRATFNYRKHSASTTADPVRFPEAFSGLFEKHLGDPLVDQRLCRRLLAEMLLNVARMTWRREPARARAALRRLFRCDGWAVRAWPYFLLARLRAGSVT
jgi:glycosyltransferase involved in cell wall biosynthesis